jgi:hypothetical protein
MLRALVVVLLLANLAFFAWTQGWIDDFAGVRARGDREPERIDLQVQPERVQLLPAGAIKASAGAAAGAASAAAVPASAPPPPPTPTPAAAPVAVVAAASAPVPLTCLEAGPFSAAEAAAAEAAVRAALPEGSWTSQKASRPGLWMVYLGRFKDRDELLKRQEELRGLRVEYDDLRSPADLVPGLSLGRFEERSNAANALERISQRGIRGAKVIEVRVPSTTVMLRVDKAGPALAAQAAALGSAALGKGFSTCAKPVAN